MERNAKWRIFHNARATHKGEGKALRLRSLFDQFDVVSVTAGFGWFRLVLPDARRQIGDR